MRDLPLPQVRAGLIAAGLVLTCSLVYFLFYRIVNLDEGWYLWAAKLVYEGKLPYRDFAYTQTPLLPYFYGAILQVVGHGLYQGRVITVGLGLLAAGLTVHTAYRRGGKIASLCTAWLWATSWFVIAHYSYTASYALAGVLLAAVVWCASATPRSKRELYGQAILVSGLLALGVATRLSLVLLAPLFLLYLLWRAPGRRAPLAGIWVGTFGLGILFTIGPFLYLDSHMMFYDIFGFHVDRVLRWSWHLQKMGRVIGHTSWDLLAVVILNGILLAMWIRRRVKYGDWLLALPRVHFELLLAGGFLSLLFVHLIPSTTSSHYNTLQAPLLFISAAIGLARLRWERVTIPIFVGVLCLHLLHQTSVVTRDHLLSRPPTNQIEVVHAAADSLRSLYPHGGTILTFNTHLALEAGMTVPDSYAMSIFSYRPTWSTEEAILNHAVNNELLIRHLQTGVDAVALSQFDLELLYGDRDSIMNALYAHYRLWRTYPGFDPFRDRLFLYLPPQSAAAVRYANQLHYANGMVAVGYEYAVTEDPKSGNANLELAIYWQAPESPMNIDYTIAVHLVDDEGRLLAGWDNPPCRNTCPTSTWRAGEWLRDEYTLTLSPDWHALVRHVRVGIYATHDGQLIYPANADGRGDHRLHLLSLHPVDRGRAESLR